MALLFGSVGFVESGLAEAFLELDPMRAIAELLQTIVLFRRDASQAENGNPSPTSLLDQPRHSLAS